MYINLLSNSLISLVPVKWNNSLKLSLDTCEASLKRRSQSVHWNLKLQTKTLLFYIKE